MLQVGPLKPVDLQLQLNSPRLSFEHIPPFLQGFGKQESDEVKKDRFSKCNKDFMLLINS